MIAFDEICSDGRRDVQSSPLGSLSLYCRYKLWKWMDARFTNGARKRRVLLNVYAIKQAALPQWQTWFNDRSGELSRYISVCHRFVTGHFSSDDVSTFLFNDREDLESIGSHDGSPLSFDRALAELTLMAARAATEVGATDEPCLRDDPPRPGTVFAGDPLEYDGHYICSIIAAHGSEWEGASQVEMRRQYWLTWINELLPVICGDIAGATETVFSGFDLAGMSP